MNFCWWTFLYIQQLGSRRGDDQCERCNFGYRLSSSFTCEAYPCSTGGNSSCKTCKDQTARGNDNQCSACNAGYELKDSMCRAYVCNPGAGEACKTCKPLALRTQDEAGVGMLRFHTNGTAPWKFHEPDSFCTRFDHCRSMCRNVPSAIQDSF